MEFAVLSFFHNSYELPTVVILVLLRQTGSFWLLEVRVYYPRERKATNRISSIEETALLADQGTKRKSTALHNRQTQVRPY
jgi:hypothetical protein